MSQPSGSAIAARSCGAEASNDSASASTRATRYWTAMRAASRSRLARRRAIVTARAPISPTVMTPVQWSAMPKALLVAPSGIDTTNAKAATIAVCLVDAPIAAITGPMRSSSTSTARVPGRCRAPPPGRLRPWQAGTCPARRPVPLYGCASPTECQLTPLYIRRMSHSGRAPRCVSSARVQPITAGARWTNTYVIEGWAIDPRPDDAGHLEAVRAAAPGGLAGVVLTPATRPFRGGGAAGRPGDAAARRRAGGAAAGARYAGALARQRVPRCRAGLLHGDTVLGSGSVFIAPGEGSLSAYLSSLERLRKLDLRSCARAMAPTSGTPRQSSTSTSPTA